MTPGKLARFTHARALKWDKKPQPKEITNVSDDGLQVSFDGGLTWGLARYFEEVSE